MKVAPKYLIELKKYRTAGAAAGSSRVCFGIVNSSRYLILLCFCAFLSSACSEQAEQPAAEALEPLTAQQEKQSPDIQSSIQKIDGESAEEIFSESREAFLSRALSEYLAYPASPEINMVGVHQTWTLLCGKPIGAAGNPIDYSKTSIADLAADGVVDDYFCALMQGSSALKSSATPSKWTLHELVVASSDSPLFEWIERYDLPESILDSEQ